MTRDSEANPVAWPLALAAAAVLGTLATACMMPFVAIAAIAAATMPRAQAIIALLGVWAVNQLLGFGLLGYPLTGYALGWGVALCGAGLAALFVAQRMMRTSPPSVAALVASFAIAFVAYEALLFAFALVAGGTGTFTPAIIWLILANEAAWFGGLSLLYLLLTRGAPGVFGRAPAVRLV